MNTTASCLMDGAVFVGSGYDADEKKEPWLYYYSASQINMDLTKVDRFGKVEMYVFTEEHETADGNRKYTHDVYTDAEYATYESTEQNELGKIIGEPLPSLPIKAIYSQRKTQGEILPMPKNLAVAGLCIAVYNAESDQKWVLRVQGHAIFVIKSDIGPNGIGDGLSSVLHIDVADSAGGAEFVAPPAELSREHRESKAELLGQLFELMRHGGVIAQRSAQVAESGVAKAFTFRPVSTAISKSRKIAEQIDAYVVDVYKYYKNTDIDFEVRYKKDFTPTSGLDVIDLLAMLGEFNRLSLTENAKAVLAQLAIKAEGGEIALEEISQYTAQGIVPNE
jgi:hypothetical protein